MKQMLITFQMMLQQGGVKIWRPRQIYVGPPRRDYVPVENREEQTTERQVPSAVEHSGITKRTRLAVYSGKARL
jgi:citrate synthase